MNPKITLLSFLFLINLLNADTLDDIRNYPHDITDEEIEWVKSHRENCYVYLPAQIGLDLADVCKEEKISDVALHRLIYQANALKKRVFLKESVQPPLSEFVEQLDEQTKNREKLQEIRAYMAAVENGDAQLIVQADDVTRSGNSCKVFCSLIVKNCLTVGALHVRGNALIDGSLQVNGGIIGLPPIPVPIISFAYIYNRASSVTPSVIPANGDIPLNTNGPKSLDILHSTVTDPERITFTVGGTYLVSYVVAGLLPAEIELFLNGLTPVIGTPYGLGVLGGLSLLGEITGIAIISVCPGDFITIRNASTLLPLTLLQPLDVTLLGAPTPNNAAITILRITSQV